MLGGDTLPLPGIANEDIISIRGGRRSAQPLANAYCLLIITVGDDRDGLLIPNRQQRDQVRYGQAKVAPGLADHERY